MINLFTVRKVEMSDDSELYEVVTPDGCRIASSCFLDRANILAELLNIELNDWSMKFGIDAVINGE